MSLTKNEGLSLLIVLTLLIGSCTNSGNKTQSEGEQKSDCNCPESDAQGLAIKITNEFRGSKNSIMVLDSLEQKPNCNWIATFKIMKLQSISSYYELDRIITKRFICDGREIYTE